MKHQAKSAVELLGHVRMILPSLVSLLLTGIPLQAAPIRISFLADQSALQETVNLLIASGCHLDGVSGFKKVVDQFNSNPLKLDLARFPSAQNGYYSFASVSNLVAAMPETWCTIDHPYEINCFDTAILLTQEQLRASLQADEMTGPFLVEMMMGTNEVRSIAATPSDAFELVSPEWYRKISENFIPRSLTNQRPYLVASLQRFYVLPNRTTEENVAGTAKRILDLHWKKMGMVFPTNSELVLCHSLLNPIELGTVHAGVLFNGRDHYTYIEKSGGAGPFVRLDFTEKSHLKDWLAAHMAFHLGNRAGSYFVTFNDKSIERLAFPRFSFQK